MTAPKQPMDHQRKQPRARSAYGRDQVGLLATVARSYKPTANLLIGA